MENIIKAVEAGIIKAEEYTETRSVPKQGDPEGYYADYYLRVGQKQALKEVLVMLKTQPKPSKISKPIKKNKFRGIR